LSNLLSQRKHFRHFLEEPVSRKGTLVISWPGHTLLTRLAPKCCSEAPPAHRDIAVSALLDRIQARANGGRKTIPPISGPTGLRGHRQSPPLGCPKLLWRPGQLTRSDGVRQSNRSVWSGFRPDMSGGAWQRPSSCVGRSFNRLVHALNRATPVLALICGWSAWRGGRRPPRTPLVAEHYKGSERYGHLNDDRAEREQPDFSLGFPIHGSRNAQRHGSFQGSRIWRASKATENARNRPENG